MSRGPLQTNATLTAVTTATAATGGRDDWDETEGVEPTGAGTSKWSGSEPVYYRESFDKLDGNVYVRRTLWLQNQTARTIGIDSDDVLTFTAPSGISVTATVTLLAYADAGSKGQAGYALGPRRVSPGIETCRLELTAA